MYPKNIKTEPEIPITPQKPISHKGIAIYGQHEPRQIIGHFDYYSGYTELLDGYYFSPNATSVLNAETLSQIIDKLNNANAAVKAGLL